MHISPTRSFLGGLGVELWSESRVHTGAWMCGALRWWAWCFNLTTGGPRARWMQVVHNHVLSIADQERDGMHENVKQAFGERVYLEATTRLRNMNTNFKSYDLVLNILVDRGIHFGRLTSVECTRLSLRAVCKVCYGGLPVARTRANNHFQRSVS